MAASYKRWGSSGGGGPVRGSGGYGGYNVLGRFVPKPIAWLITATIAFTAFGSLLQRNGVPVLEYMILAASSVFQGQVWRLATWPLVEPAGLNLLFGCMFLYFIGPDVLASLGTRRFFLLYFGGAALVGVIVCLIGRFVWPDVYGAAYATMWPMLDALAITWAVRNPSGQILAMLVLPVGGRHLITLTIGMTLIFALIDGFARYSPHFVAEFLALVYNDVFSFRRLYLQSRMAMLQRDYKRRTAHLRMVERDEEKPPRWMH
jgi:membrane associated rhomboid family serine protease